MKKILLVAAGIAALATPFLVFADGGFFVVPTSTVPNLTANVSSTVSDPGLLLLVVLAIGIPLTFYVLHQLIGLIPKSRGKK